MGNINNAIVCVVIYNIKITNAAFYKSFIAAKYSIETTLVIYDNSLERDDSANKFPKGYNIIYEHNPLNGGVADAYNFAGKLCSDQKKDWVILFDQDTQINDSYFIDLFEAIDLNGKVKLFCPQTKSNDILISPSSFRFGRSWVSSQTNLGLTNTKQKTLINSGLAVCIQEFLKLEGYTTSLPLDFSDHYFFYKYKKTNDYFFLLKTINYHELSSLNELDLKSTFNRFKIYYKGAVAFRNYIQNDFVLFWAFLRAIKLSIKFKKHQFLTHALTLQKK